MMMISIGKV